MVRVTCTRLGFLVLAALVPLAPQACVDERAPTAIVRSELLAAPAASVDQDGRYLIVFAAERIKADFAERVAKLGGAVEASLDSIGVAAVSGLTHAAAAELAADEGIRSVERDAVLAASPDDADGSDDALTQEPVELLAAADATASPTTAQFYPRQWNMRAVFAPEAWAAGHLGSRDVVVAILDTGIDYLHPDLVGLVDLGRSKSFVPEENAVVESLFPGNLPFSDLFWHGTAVASVVASNARVMAGVNRQLTLLAVKIADRRNQSSAGAFLSGIVYAADQGADVINLSNGLQRDKSENAQSETAGTVAAFERAVNYAFRKGALVITVPFNDHMDLDHNRDKVRLPCEAANAVCVAATGPITGDGLNGPWHDVDAIAPYSAFGRSAIDVAAPGGGGPAGVIVPFTRVWVDCTTTWTENTLPPACRFDACRLRSVPRSRDCILQGQGTSFAAPTVTGLAALLVAQLGHGNPALIRARIQESADDLGEPGMDPYYGHGRINIARALGVVR